MVVDIETHKLVIPKYLNHMHKSAETDGISLSSKTYILEGISQQDQLPTCYIAAGPLMP